MTHSGSGGKRSAFALGPGIADGGVGGVFLSPVHCVIIGNDGLVYVCDRLEKDASDGCIHQGRRRATPLLGHGLSRPVLLFLPPASNPAASLFAPRPPEVSQDRPQNRRRRAGKRAISVL